MVRAIQQISNSNNTKMAVKTKKNPKPKKIVDIKPAIDELVALCKTLDCELDNKEITGDHSLIVQKGLKDVILKVFQLNKRIGVTKKRSTPTGLEIPYFLTDDFCDFVNIPRGSSASINDIKNMFIKNHELSSIYKSKNDQNTDTIRLTSDIRKIFNISFEECPDASVTSYKFAAFCKRVQIGGEWNDKICYYFPQLTYKQTITDVKKILQDYITANGLTGKHTRRSNVKKTEVKTEVKTESDDNVTANEGNVDVNNEPEQTIEKIKSFQEICLANGLEEDAFLKMFHIETSTKKEFVYCDSVLKDIFKCDYFAKKDLEKKLEECRSQKILDVVKYNEYGRRKLDKLNVSVKSEPMDVNE